MFTCKTWKWKELNLFNNQYEKLLNYPSTISKYNIKDIKVFTLYINNIVQDVICVKWETLNLPNLELFFSNTDYNKIVA